MESRTVAAAAGQGEAAALGASNVLISTTPWRGRARLEAAPEAVGRPIRRNTACRIWIPIGSTCLIQVHSPRAKEKPLR